MARQHLITATTLLGMVLLGCRRPPGVDSQLLPAGFSEPAARRIYRHSVIPGGVRSGEELEAKLREDPAVKAHYASTATARLRAVVLTRDHIAYVSYRTRRGIAWTKKPVRISKGELVLADATGEPAVRARCGNRITESSAEPVEEVTEPPAEEFDWADTEAEFDREVRDLLPLRSAGWQNPRSSSWRLPLGPMNSFGGSASPSPSKSGPVGGGRSLSGPARGRGGGGGFGGGGGGVFIGPSGPAALPIDGPPAASAPSPPPAPDPGYDAPPPGLVSPIGLEAQTDLPVGGGPASIPPPPSIFPVLPPGPGEDADLLDILPTTLPNPLPGLFPAPSAAPGPPLRPLPGLPTPTPGPGSVPGQRSAPSQGSVPGQGPAPAPPSFPPPAPSPDPARRTEPSPPPILPAIPPGIPIPPQGFDPSLPPSVDSVPEPGTLSLVALAAVMIASYRLHSRRP